MGYSFEDSLSLQFTADECLAEIRGHGFECDVVDDPDVIDGRMIVSNGEVVATDQGDGGFAGKDVLFWLGY